jgi:beta-lactamase regulating signal transducer with metallopeptidase domain
MSLLEIYIFVNITLVIGFFATQTLTKCIKHFIESVSSEQILNIHYFILLASILSVASVSFGPEKDFEFPTSQKFTSVVSSATTNLTEIAQTPIPSVQVESFNLGAVFGGLVLFIVFLNLFRLTYGAFQTHQFVKSGFLYKKIGRLSVYLAEKSASPYAFSYIGKSYVSIPIGLLGDMKNLIISSKHELQHIRHKDTLVSYLGSVLKAVFFFNPAVYFWVKEINLEQEFSCDEKIISSRGVSEQDYKNCLFEVVKLGRDCDLNLVGATGFFFGTSRSELIRRIETMSKNKSTIKKSSLAVILTAALSVVSISAFALNAHSGFGKLDSRQVQKLIDKSGFSEEFRVDLNAEVLEQLNRLTNSAKGRKHSRMALKNYKSHEQMIQKLASDYDLPTEIAAVAFVESAFTNPKQKTGRNGVGMWQFIYSTADAYGLVVEGKDKRTDVQAATEAAMKYLSTLNVIFGDLRLAMLSYNAGENAVFNGMKKSKTRDPWIVMENGLNYDKGYLAKIMAAAIVMKNPDLVR